MVIETSGTVWYKTKQLSNYVSSRVFPHHGAQEGTVRLPTHGGVTPAPRDTAKHSDSYAQLIKDQSYSLEVPERVFPKNESFVSEDFLSDLSESDDDSSRGNWDNPIEFLLSCLSFAVGLGNIWRFPYLCYRNGGGAFLIPYVISLIFMGIPVFLFEMSAGQYSSEGPISLWKICPLFQGIGYGMCGLSLYIGTYYNIILSWAFFYIFSSFASALPWASCGNWWNSEACRRVDSTNCTAHYGVMTSAGDCIRQQDVTVDVWRNVTEELNQSKMPSDEFFHNFMLDISKGIHDLGAIRWELAICLLLAWVIVYGALWNGIKSFGKLVYFTALFPYLILVILLVRAATLPGYMDGINFYLTPKWEKLLEINVWADACIQIFFSLGVTWGGMITLASYNKFENNVFRDALIVGLGNCLTSFFAGFVIFGIIGYMAHELGVKVEDVAAQGAGLAFIAYPEAVSRMPISPLWSILFFLMLLSLGFGTQFSTTETVVTIILDEFPHLRGKNRRWLLLGVCAFMYCAGLFMITEGGMYVLQLVDNHSATYSALILGCCEVSVMAWIYGADRFLEDMKYMLGFYPYPRLFWKWAWKVISPVIVVSILIFTWVDYDGNSYGEYNFPGWANALGWIITFSSVILIPIVATIKIYNETGTFTARIQKLTQPTFDWGPASPQHRRLPGATCSSLGGYTGPIQGSNVTLVTNTSTSNIKDIKDTNFSNLEPLNEDFEEDTSSEDDGLNMKAIREEALKNNNFNPKTEDSISSSKK